MINHVTRTFAGYPARCRTRMLMLKHDPCLVTPMNATLGRNYGEETSYQCDVQ